VSSIGQLVVDDLAVRVLVVERLDLLLEVPADVFAVPDLDVTLLGEVCTGASGGLRSAFVAPPTTGSAGEESTDGCTREKDAACGSNESHGASLRLESGTQTVVPLPLRHTR